MTQTNRFPTHPTVTTRAGRRPTHAPLESGRRPSARLISEAVVASYIHEISQRHRNSDGRPRRPAHYA